MTNADRIRTMSDAELSDFMCQIEREEVPYFGDCRNCIMRPCGECRMEWLKKDPDEFKEDPETFEIILGTVDVLFPSESTYHRATLAGEVYKKLRRKIR